MSGVVGRSFVSTFDAIVQLSYTRGASIPVTLTIQSSDTEALDLLSAASAVDLRLLRALALKYGNASAAERSDKSFFRLVAAEAKAKNVHMRDRIDEAAVAVWWPEAAPVGAGLANRAAEDTRVLQGEVHLKSTPTVCLYPSGHLGRYRLSVCLILSFWGPLWHADVAGCALTVPHCSFPLDGCSRVCA